MTDENEVTKTEAVPANAKVHLLAAIHKAQGEIETVRKNGENPHFRSKYATLDEVWETVRKPLHNAGLVVYCTMGYSYSPSGEMKSYITTHLAEVKSGEEVSCDFILPVAGNGVTPQNVGSAITYARRYSLCAMLEIQTGDGMDDDGNTAEVLKKMGVL